MNLTKWWFFFYHKKEQKNVEREDFGRGYWSEVTCDYILGRVVWAAFSKSTEEIKLVNY